MITTKIGRLVLFWEGHPALYYGLLLLFGAAFAYVPRWELLIPLFFLLLPDFITFKSGKFIMALMLMAGSFLAAYQRCPALPEHDIKGVGFISINRLEESLGPFTKSTRLFCNCKLFLGQNKERFKNVPVVINTSLGKGRIKADCNYLVTGTLVKKGSSYFLKAAHFKPLKNSYSSAEKRCQVKQLVKQKITTHVKKELPKAFLTSLATGIPQDRLLQFKLAQTGLSHLLAVSGFHFGLLLALFYWLLYPFLNRKPLSIALICIATCYLFFIGYTPSVFRAYIAATFYLLGKVFDRPSKGLNLLGLALIFELLINPLQLLNLGFQLSFLATAAILILYPRLNELLTKIIPKAKFSDLLTLSLFDQHLYLCLNFLRALLALTLSVHLIMIPISLFYFHEFPLISLFYNLLLPLGFSVSFAILILALMLPSPLCSPFFNLASRITELLLYPIYHPPINLLRYLQLQSMPLYAVLLLTSIIFTAALLVKIDEKQLRAL